MDTNQSEPVTDGRVNNGGSRKGAGRKSRRTGVVPPAKDRDYRPIALRARDYDGMALKVMIDALQAADCPWPSKITAAEAVLSRGHGKPVNVTAKMDLNAFAGWTNDQLDHLIADLKSVAADDRRLGAGKTIEGVPVEPARLVPPAGPETSPSSSPDTAGARGSDGQQR